MKDFNKVIEQCVELLEESDALSKSERVIIEKYVYEDNVPTKSIIKYFTQIIKKANRRVLCV